MTYDYDMLGNRIHQLSMEAGERWTLNDVADNPIRAWDSRGHKFMSHYDSLRRPTSRYLSKDERYEPQSKSAVSALAAVSEADSTSSTNLQVANSGAVPQADDLPELAQHLMPDALASDAGRQVRSAGFSRKEPAQIPPEGGTKNGTINDPIDRTRHLRRTTS